MMNFMSMEYFITVVHYRNITRAAAHLHITQQTLSAHMSALEKELGCQLPIRRTPLWLTYEGEVFYRYASEISDTEKCMKNLRILSRCIAACST